MLSFKKSKLIISSLLFFLFSCGYQPLINVRWGSYPYNYGIKSLLLINENPSSTKSQYQDVRLHFIRRYARHAKEKCEILGLIRD